MQELEHIASLAMMLLLGGMLAVVIYKLLAGQIPIAGLLEGQDADGATNFSPARAQMLVLTLFVALNYLLGIFRHPDVASLPRPPALLVGAMAASQAVYLGGKASALRSVRRMLSKLTKN